MAVPVIVTTSPLATLPATEYAVPAPERTLALLVVTVADVESIAVTCVSGRSTVVCVFCAVVVSVLVVVLASVEGVVSVVVVVFVVSTS